MKPLILVAAFAALLACEPESGAPVLPGPPLDPCGGRCSEIELCAKNDDGSYGCATICANQLHCWSGCCIHLDGTNYNVCRPSNICYGN
jgi:hypothetical protein